MRSYSACESAPRTWSASAEYRRGTNFVPGFRQPLFSDSVTSSIAGLIATHVQWSSEIGFSRGEIGFVGDKPFGVYSATSKIEYGITRSLGAFGQYTYYRYNVPLGSDAFELLPLFSRQAWMVGLTAWVPIIRR